jgi:hypothetical protein
MNMPHMYKDHLTGHKWSESHLRDYEVYQTAYVFIMIEVGDIQHNNIIEEYKEIYYKMSN